jgi:ribulose-5-phosphate 4-epimerase/fuculose-1-phosphate aldolase
MTEETRLRDQIARIGVSLFDRGLTAGSSGNISARWPDGGWLMTPTNISLGALDPARLAHFDAQGRHLSGDLPTKEAFLHFAMYAERTTASAVVHLHSSHATAVSILRDVDPLMSCPR